MVAQDQPGSSCVEIAGDDSAQAMCKQEVSVEVRGSRTSGMLPTSVTLQLPGQATVSHVKTRLESCSQPPQSITANQIKLVHAGRALANDEILARIAAEGSSSGEVTLHAVLLAPGERSAAPTPVKVGSVSASPMGPSPMNSPRYYSSQSSLASSPAATSCPTSPGGGTNPQWIEGLKKQVEDGMRKAFFDLIEKSLSEEQPDAEWIARLYAEMRDKLCALTPRRADLHQQIHEALDVELFETMVRHKAFDPADLSKLVSFVFGHLQGLCSPSRDAEVQQRRVELEAVMAQPDVTFARFAVMFLKNFHMTIDDIENDMAAFRKTMGNLAPMPTPDTGTPVSSSTGASPAGGVQELKARLKQMGVAEEVLNSCVEKRELDALLEKANGRASGTVSGGVLHPSLISKPSGIHQEPSQEEAPATSPGNLLRLEAEGAVGAAGKTSMPVNFKIMQRGAPAPLEKTMTLPRNMKAAGVRTLVSRVCGIEDAESGIKLVFAGRVLADDEQLDSLSPEEALQIYVVLPKFG
jgi:hypothetical protein